MTSFSSEAFLLLSRSASLTCTEPGKSAEYHLQLTPTKGSVPSRSDVTWSVHAQYTRNGSPLKWATKCSKESFSDALAAYQLTLQERLDHAYDVDEPKGESLLTAKLKEALKEATPGLPHWRGFASVFLETAKCLKAHRRIPTHWMFASTLALADIAYGMPEGVSDAVTWFKGFAAGSDPKVAMSKVSPETRDWLMASFAIDKSMYQFKAFDELQALCTVVQVH